MNRTFEKWVAGSATLVKAAALAAVVAPGLAQTVNYFLWGFSALVVLVFGASVFLDEIHFRRAQGAFVGLIAGGAAVSAGWFFCWFVWPLAVRPLFV